MRLVFSQRERIRHYKGLYLSCRLMGSYRLSKPIRPHKARGRGAGGRGNMKGEDGIEIEPDAPNVGNGVIDICFGPCHDMCAMLLFRIGALYRRKQSFNMCGGETTLKK